MKIQIDIENLLNTEDFFKDIPKEFSISEIPITDSSNLSPEEFVLIKSFIIEWTTPVIQGLLACWLYDKIKNLNSKIRLNGEKISNNEKGIENQIEQGSNKVVDEVK